jgi:methylenetetrahydrofolate reductase (NADPH)
MSHLTCVGSGVGELGATLERLRALGIENVLALGGDLPPEYVAPPDALTYANELVALVRSRFDYFCVGGACYPETHLRAPSPESDLAMLVQKVRAGVDFLITNLFFDNADYFAFVERARSAGISVPIVPGIMPIVSTASIRRMTALCGSRIPAELGRALDARGRRRRADPRSRRRVGHGAVSGAPAPRRARPALLHAEPLTGDAKDLAALS